MENIVIAITIAIVISAYLFFKIIEISADKKYKKRYKRKTYTYIEDNEQNTYTEENIKEEPVIQEIFPYEKKYLLTKNEWYFYKKLKPVADKLGYTVLAKIRMADLIDIKRIYSYSERMSYFAKIRSKHVDFALAKPENLLIELLIELDDSSHYKNKDRDDFVNTVYQKTGYKLLRVFSGEQELENKITAVINQ